MDDHMTLPDIVARLDEQKNRRKAQRDAEPGGQAIARQRAARKRAAASDPSALREYQIHLSSLAYAGLIRLAVDANYVASVDTGRAKGLSEFVAALFNPAEGVIFEDRRPEELTDPDFLPSYAGPDRLDYKFWWTHRMDRESDSDHWRLPRHIRMTEATFARIIRQALIHQIANPDRIHKTWDAVAYFTRAVLAEPDATLATVSATIHHHSDAQSQASAVLEAVGLGHLHPRHLPHSNKARRFRRQPLTDLDFF